MSDESLLTHDPGRPQHRYEGGSNSWRASTDDRSDSISPERLVEIENPDALRSRVRNALLQASKDGRLASAMGHSVSIHEGTEQTDNGDVQHRNGPGHAHVGSVLSPASEQAVINDEQSFSDEPPLHVTDVFAPSLDGTFVAASPTEQHASQHDAVPGHELRARAVHAMLQAAADGTLASALLAVSQQHSERADAALLDEFAAAEADGTALADVEENLESDGDQQMTHEEFAQVHEPEQPVADEIFPTTAATDGEPQNTLGESSLEALRVQTADALLRAVEDGTLQSALEAIRVQHEVHEQDQIEGLRARAASTLLQAAFNGTLMSALSAIRPERDSLEDLRRQAQDALMQAAQSGRLELALHAAGLQQRQVNRTNVPMIMQEARRRGRQLAAAGAEGGNLGMCTICLDWIMLQDDFCTLHCLHFFHSSCIEHWLHSRHTCPNCRVPTDESE